MQIFKTEILKNEFERLQKEILVEILKCGYCQKTACESWHNKFLVNCKFCRQALCKPCHNFNIAKETLIKGVDSVAKDYIEILLQIFFVYQIKLLKQTFK